MNAVAKLSEQAQISGAGFFWLSAFYFVYCGRPEDWFHGLGLLPMAKIAGLGAILALLFGAGKGKRKFRDLPLESYYLLAMIVVLYLAALLSPVWRGGALSRTLEFSKVYIVWVLTFLLVTDLGKFRRIVFIQTASVAVISLVSIIKGHSQPRLEGVLGGIYSNPNDLAFAIVLSLPFCFVFLLTTRSLGRKLLWISGMLAMAAALFMTASRGGFITLLVAGTVCLWHFAIRGRRLYLIAASGLVVVILLMAAGGPLRDRLSTLWNDEPADTKQENSAYDSYEQRKFLMERAIEGIKEHPVLGLGARNFETYSSNWHEVHMTYLQIAVEAGIPALVLYLLFFGRGFQNLRRVLKHKLDPEVRLLAGAIHSCLIGFVVGALFSPEA
ncbi:MAG: O-antigen ligase family protein, partial [Acidobacteria bacterium]|nr:O-antigen ligase family protein [Acidobacteriota bacterium]